MAAADPKLERLLKAERLAFERYDRLRGYPGDVQEVALQSYKWRSFPHRSSNAAPNQTAVQGLRNSMQVMAERGMNTADKRLVKTVGKRVGAFLRTGGVRGAIARRAHDRRRRTSSNDGF